MDILIKALQLILSLSILVAFHEAGHFVAARVFKTRVEKFYLFFNPWFSLFKFKYKETEYGIGWLPLGGYVKIAGMIDESMDKEQMKEPAKPWEFRSKPAWQRLIIMLGGVTVNLILGIFIYSMILFAWGKEYIPVENAKYGALFDSTAFEVGLQHGDRILDIDGKTFDKFNEVSKHILFKNAKQMHIQRGSELMTIDLPEDFKDKILASGKKFVTYAVPFKIDSLMADMPALKAGLQKGDIITHVGGAHVPDLRLVTNEIKKYQDQEISVEVLRNGTSVTLPVMVTESGTIGIYPVPDLNRLFDVKRTEYTFMESIPAGISLGWKTLVDYATGLKLLFSKEGAKQLGGFGTIGNLFPKTWDWLRFWEITAFLSLILAFMNVLPIPALDGGHVMFLMYEIITGREPNEKFLEYAQIVGMILLLSLLVFANGNDILRAFN